MDIVFAKPSWHYDSYTDFWTLVQLSGFEVCRIDEVQVDKPRAYIMTPMTGPEGEWETHIHNQLGRPHNAHLIHWCLERPSGAGGMFEYGRSNRSRIYRRVLDDVWVSDRRMSLETMLRFVVLGSDYGLGEPGAVKVFDFSHMSYLVNRRVDVYAQFDNRLVGPNCWGSVRHAVLQASRFALNIHQDQYPFQEPLRWALFAAYGLPMLTEEVYDAYPWTEDLCVFNPYDGIVGKLKEMLANDYARWRDMGLRARDLMCKQFRFKNVVIQAVKESMH